MKNNVFSLPTCAAMCILAAAFTAPAVSGQELFRPYIGAGVQVLKLQLDKAYGQPLFQKGVVPGSTVFAGVRVGDFVGIELGSNYFSRKRESVLNGEDLYPGSGETVREFLAGTEWLKARTAVLIKDVNIGLTGYLPLEKLACMLSKTEIFGTLGFSRTSVSMRFQAIADDLGPLNNDPTNTFRAKKTIPIARIGLQQNVTENINLSLFSEWKRLKAFKMALTPSLELRLKNSLSYGLRLGYAF